MNAKYILQNLAGLDALSLSCTFENNRWISVLQIDPFNYGLFVYSLNSYRISFFKLSVKESICHYNEDFVFSSTNRTPDTSHFEIYLLNVFCLPFTLLTIICTKTNVWAVGKETVVNLAPFVDQALLKEKSYENDNTMDVDLIEEYQPYMWDITLPLSISEKYNLHCKDLFFGCHFLDCGLIRCQKNSSLARWNLEFLLSSDSMMSSDIMALSFLDFPVSYHTSSVASNQGQNEVYKPLITFIHHSDPESCMFRSLFGINCASPNVICLVGHPDGKLLWSLCDSNNQFHASHELQVLFHLKQPIVGIFFVKDIEGLEGCDCMLLVGALGQITFISSKCYPSFIQDSGGFTFWTKTIYISSSVSQCDISNNCLLYISKHGALSLLDLSVITHANNKCEEVSISSVSEFDCIEEMIVIDKSKGLIILKTKYGKLYLTQLKKSMESEIVTSSLPSLMNECLKQSNKLQELLNKKALQNRLFATISTFASLKFLKNILKEPMTFSISEINEEPKKYILVINLKCLDSLNLDPELCFAFATAFTYFKNSNCFITKSVPYKADEPTLCLAFTDTALQPPFLSVFPLFVEVGLILQLPERWKTIDCFNVISSFLPFYIRVQTFMVHELNLLQNNALCFPQSLKLETPKTLKLIKELGMRRPASNILQLDSKRDFNFLKKFSLCVSISAVEEMLKNTCDSDPCTFIEKLLHGNILESSTCKESYLMSKCSPITVKVSKDNSHILITLTANNLESLIGLRIAVMETLLANSRKSMQSTNTSAHVNIPASIYRRCEEISKCLMNLYGKDVESDEITHKIINLYKELRTDVSAKLPVL